MHQWVQTVLRIFHPRQDDIFSMLFYAWQILQGWSSVFNRDGFLMCYVWIGYKNNFLTLRGLAAPRNVLFP